MLIAIAIAQQILGLPRISSNNLWIKKTEFRKNLEINSEIWIQKLNLEIRFQKL